MYLFSVTDELCRLSVLHREKAENLYNRSGSIDWNRHSVDLVLHFDKVGGILRDRKLRHCRTKYLNFSPVWVKLEKYWILFPYCNSIVNTGFLSTTWCLKTHEIIWVIFSTNCFQSTKHDDLHSFNRLLCIWRAGSVTATVHLLHLPSILSISCWCWTGFIHIT